VASEHGRTPEQIRAEIAAERASLDQAVSSLVSDAKRTARLAGSGATAFGGLMFVWRLLRRRRRNR
jgi:hypothetical protein